MASFEYNKSAKLAPLYVGQYDFNRTLDELNKISGETEKLTAGITNTKALNPDEYKKNSVFRRQQDELNSVLNDTNLSPWERRKGVLNSALNHANDQDLQAYEKSLGIREGDYADAIKNKETAELAQGRLKKSDAMFEKQGGTNKDSLGQYSYYDYERPAASVDFGKYQNELAQGFHANSIDKESYAPDNQGNFIIKGSLKENVIPDRVVKASQSVIDNDSNLKNYIKQSSEDQLFNVYSNQLREQNPNIKDSDVYDFLNTPRTVEKEFKVQTGWDENNNPIYKSIKDKFAVSPIEELSIDKEQQLINGAVAKSAYQKTQNRVDIKDNWLWRELYKKKSGKQEEAENFRPNTIGTEGLDTEFDIGLDNLDPDLKNFSGKSLTALAKETTGEYYKDEKGNLKYKPPVPYSKKQPTQEDLNKQTKDREKIDNLFTKVDLGDSSKLTYEQKLEALKKWNTDTNKRNTNNAVTLGNSSTQEAITKAIVKNQNLENSQIVFKGKKYTYDELVNQMYDGDLEDYKPSNIKNKQDVRNYVTDNIRLGSVRLKPKKGLPSAMYEGTLGGNAIYVKPENELIKNLTPYAELQQQVYNPESSGKLIEIPIYDNSTGQLKGHTNATIKFKGGTPIVVNENGDIISVGLTPLLTGASMGYHKSNFKLPVVTQTQSDKD